MKPDIPAPEVGARARAAIAYAGLTHPKLADKSGLHKDIIRAITQKAKPRGAMSTDELHAIADACGVPRRFMELGFEGLAEADPEQADLRELVNSLTTSVVALQGGQRELADAVRRLSGEAPGEQPGR